MTPEHRKDHKEEFKVRPNTVTHVVISNELFDLKRGNAGFTCSHGPKIWRKSKPGQRYNLIRYKYDATLAWFLLLHVTLVSCTVRTHFVTTELKIVNGMHGLKRPEIVYHCQAINSGLDYGWRRAIKPPFGHSFTVLLEGGLKLEEETHRCHFRSVLGTANVDIRMTAIDSEMCNNKNACAVHVATPEGIWFDGKEWDFEERYPRLVPKKYIEARWKPWPRRSKRSRVGSQKQGDVGFTLMMKNEMYGLKRPVVLYRCKSSNKSLRWHISSPHAEFKWDFEVPPFGTGVVIHHCEFRSSQGTAEVEIKTLSMTSMLCGGHVCTYVIRPNGVYFVGFETYYPHNILLRFLELVRPVDKLVEPWKAWSPTQLKALRERNITRSEPNVIHGDKDVEQEEDDD
ncbi:hypothetical protein CARUB_v10002514mg [Capsella rubella]|uniref:S-protein homolog n=1 Tax=Capsella rubella TaxID=81985 RepID=R0FBW4_9BRAS|nr:hypothetical protein CARUB_v10002514mg [Capsella rubella]